MTRPWWSISAIASKSTSSKKVLALAQRLDALHLDGVLESRSHQSGRLSVYYEPLTITAAALEKKIAEILDGLRDCSGGGPPVGHPGLLRSVARSRSPRGAPRRCSLSVDQLIALHSGTTYHAYMLGFLPGLAYLGDLPEKLVLPRRNAPRPADSRRLARHGREDATCIFAWRRRAACTSSALPVALGISIRKTVRC